MQIYKANIETFKGKKIHIIKINLTLWQFEYANIDSIGFMVGIIKKSIVLRFSAF